MLVRVHTCLHVSVCVCVFEDDLLEILFQRLIVLSLRRVHLSFSPVLHDVLSRIGLQTVMGNLLVHCILFLAFSEFYISVTIICIFNLDQ